MKINNIIAAVILLIAVGGVSFYAGTKYQSYRRANGQFFSQNGFGMMRNGGNVANRNGFRPVSGDIIGSDDKSITVKLADGSSRIVFLAGNTTINKASEAGRTDLKVGEKVAVFGTPNSDGSVTAQNIQINPIDRGSVGK